MKSLTLTASSLLLVTIGCGGDSVGSMPATPSPPPNQASITVAIAPANSTPFGDPNFPWAVSFTVQLFETAGFGFGVEAIVVELTDLVTITEVQIRLAAGTTRVPPRGGLAIPLSLALTQNGLVAEVLVRGTDDNGNSIEALGRLVVIPAQGP